jgi:xylose isomerase
MLHFITTLDDPSRVGVNPELAHETMSGLAFAHAIAQAMECGKLFHVDLNAQKIGRYDQDLRFGSEDLKGAFLTVRLLEGTAARHLAADALPAGAQRRYAGPLHFDAHAYRTEDMDGVWDFARGCMRTYKILAARAEAFDRDPEVAALLAGARGASAAEARSLAPLLSGYSRRKARKLRDLALDPELLGARGLRHERLDQLMVEHLTGARG